MQIGKSTFNKQIGANRQKYSGKQDQNDDSKTKKNKQIERSMICNVTCSVQSNFIELYTKKLKN